MTHYAFVQGCNLYTFYNPVNFLVLFPLLNILHVSYKRIKNVKLYHVTTEASFTFLLGFILTF